MCVREVSVLQETSMHTGQRSYGRTRAEKIPARETSVILVRWLDVVLKLKPWSAIEPNS